MDAVIVAIIASAIGLSIPYLRAHGMGGALRAELHRVADMHQLVQDTRMADAEQRSQRVATADPGER